MEDLIMAGELSEDSEFIPLFSDDDTNKVEDFPDKLPILPLKNSVLFPGVIMPIAISREKSLKLIKNVNEGNKYLGTLSQKTNENDSPLFKDLYRVGTVAKIIKVLEMPDGTTTAILQGKGKFKVLRKTAEKPYFIASVGYLKDIESDKDGKEFDLLVESLKDLALKIVKLSSNLPPETSFAIKNIESKSFLINFISSNSQIVVSDKQALLELNSIEKRASELLKLLTGELQLLELKKDIQVKAKKDIDQQQREYMLHQQMKQIQNELGGNPMEEETSELSKRAKKKKWGKHIEKIFNKELKRFKRLNPASPEYSVQLNYIHTLLDLPWDIVSEDNFDLKRAADVLDKDHFGLEKVKERILEHLAVLKLKKDLKSPILCLVGPPGVGKTSLGKSIAEALGRNFVRMSLGGVHDESEIRGHRKTYIGAMPGRIIQNIKKVKTSNPVFVLDEIDKLGKSMHGDPSSALLEVLDPEQNFAFYDNFLETEYDLSKVMFLATANSLNSIQPALLDRMEIIHIAGYIVEEKVEIAKRHLIPEQLKNHGLTDYDISISDEALSFIVENYTRESGVRELNNVLAKIFRAFARKIASDENYPNVISKQEILQILKNPKYSKDTIFENKYSGVVTGLAWTSHGGEILFIESSLSYGKGKIMITGNLGDVMKESATLALSFVKAKSEDLGINVDIFDKSDLHIHVPEGAIPKDGPSAGITMATSILSTIKNKIVSSDFAMTGEITLRGRILPVGGIKEKILAARRQGVTNIILSKDNKKDVDEVKETYLDGLNFHYVDDILEVFNIVGLI